MAQRESHRRHTGLCEDDAIQIPQPATDGAESGSLQARGASRTATGRPDERRCRQFRHCVSAEESWDVVGVTMKTPNACIPGEGNSGVDAARVCSQLGIAHYLVDVTEAFHDIVIGRFRDVYAAGKTPNPCVECNARLKLGLVWDLLEETFGIGRLATGHYARIAETPYGPALRRRQRCQGPELFLIASTGDGWASSCCRSATIPRLRCEQSRRKSASASPKTESMELCFTGEADYRSILGAEADCPGDLTDMEGRVIGTHKGISIILGRRGLVMPAENRCTWAGSTRGKIRSPSARARGQSPPCPRANTMCTCPTCCNPPPGFRPRYVLRAAATMHRYRRITR